MRVQLLLSALPDLRAHNANVPLQAFRAGYQSETVKTICFQKLLPNPCASHFILMHFETAVVRIQSLHYSLFKYIDNFQYQTATPRPVCVYYCPTYVFFWWALNLEKHPYCNNVSSVDTFEQTDVKQLEVQTEMTCAATANPRGVRQ